MAPARALALPGDPIVIADDAQGCCLHAVDRVSLLNGLPTQLTAEGALRDAQALAFTGSNTLVTVGSKTLARFDLTSGQLTIVSAPTAGEMRGVATAPDGSIFAVDFGPSGGTAADGRVVRLNTSDGSSTEVASGGFLVNPIGIAVAEDGTIFVTNSDGTGHGQVVQIDPSNGGAQSIVAADALVVPWGIAFLPDGDLVVADASYNGTFRGALVRIDPTTGVQTARVLNGLSVEIDNATGVAVDDAGEVLVTERSSAQIDRVNLEMGFASQVGSGVPSPLDVEAEPGLPPSTKILSGPSGTTRSPTPTFTFEPSQYGATSMCAIDGGDAVPCQRTFTTPLLGGGQHSFLVSSTRFGAQGAQAVRSFTVNPSAPDTLIDSGPSGLTNNATPTFTFEAPGGGTSFTCSIDAGASQPCLSPFTTAELADGSHEFTVKANNDNVGDTRSFTVDTTPPETSITSGPNENASTAATQPTFTLASTEAASTFSCNLDGTFVACTSFFTPPQPLAEGQHMLTVRAQDAAGNSDLSPVVRHFTVDTTTPVTTITGGPDGPTGEAAPTFTFSASEAGVFFRCSIDNGAVLTICASPFTVDPALADGAHTFRVQAIDAAGNTETPVQRAFSVDTVVPDTSITSGPNGPTNDSSPAFAFQSTKPQSTFVCRVDLGTPFDCFSPLQTGELTEGAHTVSVTATDAVGHVDLTPATRSFTIDTTPPRAILGGFGPFTNDPTPEFSFGSEPGATFTCSFDGSVVGMACTSPFTAPPLADGAHTLRVTATDLAGNADPAPPQLAFTVDTVAPQLTIDSGPDGDTTERQPTFSFSADEQATFACRFDAEPATDCDQTFQPNAPLALGAHSFEVVALDRAGNLTPTPVRRNFRIVEKAGEEKPKEPPPKEGEPPISPSLQLRASLKKGKLRVRASLNSEATGSISLTVTGRHGHTRVSRRLELQIRSGIATASLHVPRSITRLRLLAHYAGDTHFTPASATQTVR